MFRFLLVIALLLSPQAGDGPYDLTFLQVRDGIWMAYRPDPYRLPMHGNVTIIIDDEDVTVVDAGSSPRAARQIVAKVRELTDRPVGTLINTHGDEDHVLGNQVFAEAYPGVEIVARAETRERFENGHVRGEVRAFSRSMSARQEAGNLEAARVSRRGLNGDDLVAEHLMQYYRQDIYAVRNEYRDVRVTLPTRVFEHRMVVEHGERQIELLDLGFGKTGSDVIVYLPQERLMIAGDIVTHPVPYGFSPRQTEWLRTLRRLVELEFDDLIPGHGEQLLDKAYVEQIIGLVEFEIRSVRESIRAGRNAESTAWDITFKRWAERFVGDDPIGLYYFNEWFVKPAVERAHTELGSRN